ncbi:DUF5682 family protein, partial [Limnofasciculus baicalensis]
MSTHIFGIRHHGPGSTRALLQALHALKPDAILVEGPPDADSILPLVVHPDMKPPVALIVYRSDRPRQAVYYPFAVFSPEWQAIQYGLIHGVAVRFMDLPQTHQFGLADLAADLAADGDLAGDGDLVVDGLGDIAGDDNLMSSSPSEITTTEIRFDPLGWLGKAAGYSDGESWWEHLVEQRQDSTDLFTAILEAMTVLRQETPPLLDPIEAKREAYMRKIIRTAQKEGFQKIAVVCGAWHSPALAQIPTTKSKLQTNSPLPTPKNPLQKTHQDDTLLKKLPKIKIEVTWIPWTYGRLSYKSGYGAGVKSPGWYDHLWHSTLKTQNSKLKTQNSTPHSPLPT